MRRRGGSVLVVRIVIIVGVGGRLFDVYTGNLRIARARNGKWIVSRVEISDTE